MDSARALGPPTASHSFCFELAHIVEIIEEETKIEFFTRFAQTVQDITNLVWWSGQVLPKLIPISFNVLTNYQGCL